jgi:hypothetical protein
METRHFASATESFCLLESMRSEIFRNKNNKFQLTETRISSDQIVEAFADQHQIQFRGTITLLHEFLQSKFWEFF